MKRTRLPVLLALAALAGCRRSAPPVTPAMMKSRSWNVERLHSRKERIMETVLPERIAPSASMIRQCSWPDPGRHQVSACFCFRDRGCSTKGTM